MTRLTSISVKNAKPGRHADGNGLYLFVRPSGSRQWVLRVVVASLENQKGKRSDFGLGSALTLPLADARIKAAQWREIAKSGRNPSAVVKKEAKASLVEENKRAVTFKLAAERAFETLSPGWKNAKHRAQWINTLRTYAYPALGACLVNEIGAPEIIDALSPIWLAKPETARRTKQRIETVLDFSHSREWRDSESPSKAVQLGLPAQPKRDRHFPAVAIADAPKVLGNIENATSTMGRLALRFVIHTVARSGEVRGARWGEIDQDNQIWTIPADRMKAGKEHVVPLTASTRAVLNEVQLLEPGNESYIFPGARGGMLSDMTMTKSQKIVAPNTTVHGWRSTFRDWVAEETNFAGELAEMALAHAIGNRVEAAYRRGNLLEKRRSLMAAWEAYLTGSRSKVASIHEARQRKTADGNR